MTHPLVRLLGRAFAPALLGALSVGACSSSYDAGATSTGQLCNVLESTLALSRAESGFSLEAELEGSAREPTRVSASLVAIQLSYRTHQDSYDQLGSFEPAIRFVADLVEMSSERLLGPSTLSPRVLRSAQAIDRRLESRPCP